MFLLSLFLIAVAINAKVIILNKPVLWKDYPKACKHHGASPLILSPKNLDKALGLVHLVSKKCNKRAWIAAFENNELENMTNSLGLSKELDLPVLEITSDKDAQERKVRNLSLCWKEKATGKPALVENNYVEDDLHVDTTSPNSEAMPLARNYRKQKPRRRQKRNQQAKTSKKTSRRHKRDSSSSSSSSSSESSSSSSVSSDSY